MVHILVLLILIILYVQVTHEDRKNARREARLKDSDYSSDRTSSDKQVCSTKE